MSDTPEHLRLCTICGQPVTAGQEYSITGMAGENGVAWLSCVHRECEEGEHE